ncbi:MAG: LysR family transcriptional regulator [Alphaproteobacteria bacterium]|nr:LysR family transcriptional regulator [Alphaproteobacteria bacterium]
MDRFESLRLFIRVAHAGSFSAAARAENRSVSSVTRQIAALEDTLDVRLINRSTRRLALTEAGQVYVARIERILAELDEADHAVASLALAPRGVLRVNGPISFGRVHIARHVPAFLRLYPEVEVDLTLTDTFVDVVEEGVDVAVRVGALRDSSLIERRLAGNVRLLCASPDYLARRPAPTLPSDITDHDCLTFKFRTIGSVWRFAGRAGIEEIAIKGPFVSNNFDAIYEAVLGGLGLSILPLWMVGEELRTGRLMRVMADYRASPSDLDTAVYAVYPHNRHLSAKVRAFVDFLAARYAETRDWVEE